MSNSERMVNIFLENSFVLFHCGVMLCSNIDNRMQIYSVVKKQPSFFSLSFFQFGYPQICILLLGILINISSPVHDPPLRWQDLLLLWIHECSLDLVRLKKGSNALFSLIKLERTDRRYSFKTLLSWLLSNSVFSVMRGKSTSQVSLTVKQKA